MAIELVAANYTAIIAATIVGFIIAWVWHGPLFGKMWASLMGVDMAAMKKGMPGKIVVALITLLITNFVLFQFISWLGAATIADALMVGFWVWLGFYLMKEIGMKLWLGKPFKLLVLNAVGGLIMTLVSAAILVSV